jgi:DNA repair protein RadD
MLTLRPYQLEAKHAVYDHLRTRDDNPCVVIPTAGGKTPVIATICRDAVTLWGGRVMILAHVKELLEQTADKLRAVCPEVPFGVYSAGLKRKDRAEPVIVAGIQSIWKRACDFDPFDMVIVDEAHMIPTDGDGMYRQFLADAKVVNPHLRIVGFTATPYRLKSGSICTPEGILNHVCYEVGVRELIVQGYLCPLVSKAGKVKADTSGLHVRAGEFVAGEVEALMDDAELVRAACAEVIEATRERNACLIFASGVKHGEHIVRVLAEKHGIECGFVTGDTPTEERDATLARFKAGKLKYLCNVNVLTTGFDAPHIDCVALMRPTLSPGLYYQMVGRGFRLHPSKTNCLVLDFGGNVLRHGPVDQVCVKEREPGSGMAPAKECPECNALIAAGYAVCPECGFEFPPPGRAKHAAKASDAGILSGQVTVETLPIEEIRYSVHTKRGVGDNAPKSLRVDYKVGWNRWKSEWVCLEHDGFARQKAVAWWKKRSREPVPATAAEAVEIAKAGGMAATKSITVRSVSGEEYDRITEHELGPIPELLDRGKPCDVGDNESLTDLEFPFGYNVTTITEEEIPW